jgi:hypothetical protein
MPEVVDRFATQGEVSHKGIGGLLDNGHRNYNLNIINIEIEIRALL